jgi:hypothetical protein
MKFFERYSNISVLRFALAGIVGGIGAAYGTFCGIFYSSTILNLYLDGKMSNSSIIDTICIPFGALQITLTELYYSAPIIIVGIFCVIIFGVSLNNYRLMPVGSCSLR